MSTLEQNTTDLESLLAAVEALPEGGETIESVEQATPVISVRSDGLITATSTQEAGIVEAGTTSTTYQLPVVGTNGYTPTTTQQVISAGQWLAGDQYIGGDANLIPANIAEGVTIFGVTGTHNGSSDLTMTGLKSVKGTFTASSGQIFNETPVIVTGLGFEPKFVFVQYRQSNIQTQMANSSNLASNYYNYYYFLSIYNDNIDNSNLNMGIALVKYSSSNYNQWVVSGDYMELTSDGFSINGVPSSSANRFYLGSGTYEYYAFG